jgi:uncharacterized protein (DUF342 family)
VRAAIGLDEVRQLMRRYLEQDGGRQTLELEADSVEEALRDAAIQLSVPLKRLEYHVVEEGNPGLFGVGKKPWRVRVSEIAAKEVLKAGAEEGGAEEAQEAEPEIKDRDGEALVRLAPEGALLKVTPPLGKGRRATEKQAFDKLHSRSVRQYDQDLVARTVRDAEGRWVIVGEYVQNPANDAIASCEIVEGDMKAMLVVMPPGPGGCDLSRESILQILRQNRVVYGVREDLVDDFVDHPRYKVQVLVAEGDRPVNGKDATVQLFFETDQSKIRLRESATGRVNFKELNLIKNVVANQPLGRKIPAEPGVTGRTVTGKMLPAKDGRDIPVPLGKNVHMDENGLTIVSDINGQVMITNGKINVEEVYTVSGDVCLRTGNIVFLGTVLIKGNVEDGFSVKASGNIEVAGNVGKSDIEAEGDVIVHQGIAAKTGGHVRAGKSVWARFIENAQVEAGEFVVVSDGIINSSVDANKKIVCQGKRASIVGGHLRAAEEINAKALGSAVSGTETILEVGFDPKSKEKQEALQAQLEHLRRQIEEIDKNLITLQNLKRQKKVLSEEKEAYLQEQQRIREDLQREHEEISREIDSISAYLTTLKLKGKVSASGKVYPGVKITIRDQTYDVKNEQKNITFYLENGLIRSTRYEAVEDIDVRRGPPDAYKAD